VLGLRPRTQQHSVSVHDVDASGWRAGWQQGSCMGCAGGHMLQHMFFRQQQAQCMQ
jgi:hypothetical protein